MPTAGTTDALQVGSDSTGTSLVKGTVLSVSPRPPPPPDTLLSELQSLSLDSGVLSVTPSGTPSGTLLYCTVLFLAVLSCTGTDWASAHEMRKRRVLLSASWVSRLQSQEADYLTNDEFRFVKEENRIDVGLKKLGFDLMPLRLGRFVRC